jgi:fructose-specific phosphotransferase system component IIB
MHSIFMTSELKYKSFCNKLKKSNITSVINYILQAFIEIDQYDLRDPEYVNNLKNLPKHDELFLLLVYTFLNSNVSTKKDISTNQFCYLLKYVANNIFRKHAGIVNQSNNDFYALMGRSYNSACISMQYHCNKTALRSIIRQEQLFANTTISLANKFYNKYQISYQDFLTLYKTLLEYTTEGCRKFTIENFTHLATIVPESSKRFLNLISLDIDQGKHAMEQWRSVLDNRLDLMTIDIITPFACYPLFKYKDDYYLYSNKLLYITAHYHLYDLIRKIDQNLGDSLEQYAYSRLEEYKSFLQDSLTIEISRAGSKGASNSIKNADFILKENDSTIVLEAKAIEYCNKSKILQGKDVDNNKIKKGIEQLQSTIATINIDKSVIYGIVVTYKPYLLGGNPMWLSSGRRWADQINTMLQQKAFDPNSLFIISIEDFDDLIDSTQENNLLISEILKLIVTYRTDDPYFAFKLELKRAVRQLINK